METPLASLFEESKVKTPSTTSQKINQSKTHTMLFQQKGKMTFFFKKKKRKKVVRIKL